MELVSARSFLQPLEALEREQTHACQTPRFAAAIPVLLTVLLAALYLAPPALSQEPPPEAAAEGWVLADAVSGERLAGDNVSEELPMASTTKIMTALVVFEEGTGLDEEVTVSAEAAEYARPPYSNVGLREGDTLTVRELLTAAMLESGNDTAYTLAEHVGGDTERFVELMNRYAREMGLAETSFENPVGLDDPEHHSSARDLARMARSALSHPELREILDTPSAVIDVEGAETTPVREIPLQSTNELLASYPAATGVKTGTTPAAGPSLVASAARGDESYIAVLLDAADRFGSAAAELEYGFSAYDRRQVIEEGRRYAAEPLPQRPDEEVELVTGAGVESLVEAGAEIERRVELVEELPGSAERGERLGRVIVEADGERVAQTPLVAAEGYEEASMWQRLWYTAGGIPGEER